MKTLISIFLVLLCNAAFGQNAGEWHLQRIHTGQMTDAALDNLGNLYLISDGGQVKKLGPEGDSLSVFNGVRRNGKLQSLDVSNPLRPLVFYKDFSQVLLLDRFLSVQATLDLRRSGILQPLAAALSFDNKVWVFDAVSNKLKKLDEQGSLLQETPDLRQVFPDGVHPQQIFDHNGWVYLYDAEQGLFAFDYYGTFKRKIPIAGWQNLLVTDHAISGISKGLLQTYDLKTLMQSSQVIPAALQPCTGIKMGSQKLVALCPEGVKLFVQKP